MLEGALGGLITLCAVLGGVALAGRALRTALRAALRAAEVASASSRAEDSARRGDLTALAERRAIEVRARRGRRRDTAVALVWVAWLVLPLLLGWMPEGYALAAPLWLLSRSQNSGVRSQESGVRR